MASKAQIAFFSGLLFYVISNPITYSLVNSLLSPLGIRISVGGRPTGTGLIAHSAVYALVVYLLMKA